MTSVSHQPGSACWLKIKTAFVSVCVLPLLEIFLFFLFCFKGEQRWCLRPSRSFGHSLRVRSSSGGVVWVLSHASRMQRRVRMMTNRREWSHLGPEIPLFSPRWHTNVRALTCLTRTLNSAWQRNAHLYSLQRRPISSLTSSLQPLFSPAE